MKRLPAVLTLAAVLLLGACSSSDDGDNTSTTTAPAADTSAPASSPTPEGSAPLPDGGSAAVSVVVNPGETPDSVGAAEDVHLASCALTDGAWQVSGQVTNPTDAPATYRIYVSFLGADSTTNGLLQVDVPGAEPGKATDWSGKLGLDAPDQRCVLRVERQAA